MKIVQATAEKIGISSKRLSTVFVVILISFPVAVVVSSLYRNSGYGTFEGLSEAGESPQNVTSEPTIPLEKRVHKQNLRGEYNNTVSVVLPGNGSVAEERVTTENSTASSRVEVMVQRGTAGKVTGEVLTGGSNELGGTIQFQNITHHDSLGGKQGNNISSVSSGDMDMQETSENEIDVEGRTKNITVADGGSKNSSLSTSTNDSSTFVKLDNNDKLLGGLLTSGFDEASCKSRMQSHLFRKPSPHKPSPYLISKLRNYEEIHRRCAPNTRAYHRTMMKIVRSKNHDTATMCKYIIWTTANGLGNQMISMTATFLYAMLTDRVMLVKFERDKRGLFCEPFLNSTWILPMNSPYWSWNEKNTETYQTMLEKDKASNSNEGLPSALFINLQFSSENPEKFFHCYHSQDLLRKVPMLILRSDQYFVPSMFMNPIFNLEIAKMFPVRDTIFHHLGRYLFHPSNEAWEQISSFYNTHLAKAEEQIGIQIRVFRPDSTPKQAIMNLVLRCISKHKILPELDMQSSTSSADKNKTIKAVLVASLYQEFGDNLRTMYLNKPTVSGEVIQVYQPSHEGKQKFNDDKHNMKAWMDMYLLSLSNILVTTSLSTFGYVAQGLGNLKPWLLYRQVDNKTHSQICERDFSSEPCFHILPKHYCNGESMTDIVSSFPYLRRCKDFWYGAKLVVNSSA